ncbi:hypothetical protein CC1G_00698 [Coprinopsis cinerea okayama7|uniref:F-box domain-containing protein n=1 Tax=Coprinopsis cinerea (strain Okayama-7 / 130 / ATCC MYA-4618 / FGSC 9003) TaxID=240176 RepID=A8N3Q3_COPC7|nr:hypothetical protein CC1G_00698 [Coprinopsis cinerea okayama7\|eukprot:XP_001829519.1 hypothetical protein CC1G_00698 [Coprinopsis cinerea okayama7\
MPCHGPLYRLPLHLLDHIAFYLVASPDTDSDSDFLPLWPSLARLPPLLLTSKVIYSALSPGHALSFRNGQRYPLRTDLYARLCDLFLDTGAAKRRWWRGMAGADGGGPTSSALTAHFIRVAKTVGFYRRSMRSLDATPPVVDFYPEHSPQITEHLLTTFLMLLENDSKNSKQLDSVQAGRFVMYLTLKRLGEGRESNDEWLVENVLNTLSLWVWWLLTTKEELEQETQTRRSWIVSLILPYVLCPYRYASALAPPTHYTLPIPDTARNPIFQAPVSSQTAHGPFPVYYSHPFVGANIVSTPAQQQAQPQPPPAPQERPEVPDMDADAILAAARAEQEEREAARAEEAPAPVQEAPAAPQPEPNVPSPIPPPSRPPPTQSNSHAHPAFGVKAWWYSSKGLYYRSLPRTSTSMIHSEDLDDDDMLDDPALSASASLYTDSPWAPLTLTLPPVSMAAKLMFVARREVIPVQIPHVIPATREAARRMVMVDDAGVAQRMWSGPTQEDMREVAGFKAARVRGLAASTSPATPATTSTTTTTATTTTPATPSYTLPEPTSRNYDTEFYRMLQCGNILNPSGIGLVSPLSRSNTLDLRFGLGKVYERGMLNGLWQGFIYIPNDASLSFIARTRTFPSNFSEQALGIISRPLFMRIQEHGYIATPGPLDWQEQEEDEVERKLVGYEHEGEKKKSSKGKRPEEPREKPVMRREMDRGGGEGGPVPIPPASTLTRTFREEVQIQVEVSDPEDQVAPAPSTSTKSKARQPRRRVETRKVMVQRVKEAFLDENMNNAWLPGEVGSLRWEKGAVGEGVGDGVWRDPYTAPTSTSTSSSATTAPTSTTSTTTPTLPMSTTTFIVPTVTPESGVGSMLPEGAAPRPVETKRYTYELFEKGKESVHERLEKAREDRKYVKGVRYPSSSTSSFPSSSSSSHPETYFYHHPGCMKCRRRERVVEAIKRREEEKREKVRAEKARRRKEMDEAAEAYFASLEMGCEWLAGNRPGASGGRDDGGASGRDDGMDGDDDEEEEEWAKREVVDLNFGEEGVGLIVGREDDEEDSDEEEVECDTCFSTDVEDSEYDDEAYYSDDDDLDNDDPTSTLPTLERCTDGIEDTILTGGMDARHAEAWGAYVYYGRVRPWDGLVGILRISVELPPDDVPVDGDTPRTQNSKFFFYGYVHAGRTLVGNWRVAGVDAVAPTLESCFVVSKREE